MFYCDKQHFMQTVLERLTNCQTKKLYHRKKVLFIGKTLMFYLDKQHFLQIIINEKSRGIEGGTIVIIILEENRTQFEEEKGGVNEKPKPFLKLCSSPHHTKSKL